MCEVVKEGKGEESDRIDGRRCRETRVGPFMAVPGRVVCLSVCGWWDDAGRAGERKRRGRGEKEEEDNEGKEPVSRQEA